MDKKGKSALRRGRPREFEPDEALDAAMRVFWTRGYEATTMAELVESLGLNRASLYGAFGDKEELFLKVLERYGEKFSSRPISALAEYDDAFEAVWRFLERTAEHLTDTRLPRGCLFANTIIESPNGSAPITRVVAAGVSGLEAALYEVLRRAQAAGYISPDADMRALARFFAGVAQGMALMAKVTADPSLVFDIARTAMRAWPHSPSAADAEMRLAGGIDQVESRGKGKKAPARAAVSGCHQTRPRGV
ncbi:TetR/AcrR family transcriptional regulator [Xanthobacter aminoxidans]|uniref:TetR/AcrR family transcriptional regulator n=1 Tax=Xanthobacter aminoxidans TaxID=186280 RepID=UPI003727D5E5